MAVSKRKEKKEENGMEIEPKYGLLGKTFGLGVYLKKGYLWTNVTIQLLAIEILGRSHLYGCDLILIFI